MLLLVCSLSQAKLAPADGAASCLPPPHPCPVLQAQHVLSGRLPAADYQSKILCCTDWRRRGAAYDLAPLGNQMPSSVTPEFRPLPKSVLQAAFTLQPGSAALSEVRLLASAGWRHAAGGVCVVLQPLLLGFAAAAGHLVGPFPHLTSLRSRRTRETCCRPTWVGLGPARQAAQQAQRQRAAWGRPRPRLS